MGEEVEDKKEVTVDVDEKDMDETESDEASLLTDQKKGKLFFSQKGSWQLLLGVALIILSLLSICIIIEVGGVIVLLISGYLFLANGILLRYPAQEKYKLDVTVNGHQFKEIPLRRIALCTANIIAGMTGIAMTISIGGRGGLFWFILSLSLSSLIIIVTLQAIFDIHYKTPDTTIDKFSDIIDNSISASWKHFKGFVDAIGRTLTMVNDDKPAGIYHKPLCIFSIVMAMIVCMAIFSWQVLNINLDDNLFEDPENIFARFYINGPFGSFHRYERIWFIIASSVITFILSITMIVLLMRATQTRIFLFGVLAFGIGIAFVLYSTYTIQYIILMGTCLSPKISCEMQLVKLIIFLCIPILGSLFMALSYSSVIQMTGDPKTDNSTTTMKWLICISTSIAFLVILLASATMITTNVFTMVTVQKHWNTTINDYKWKNECQDDHDSYGYNHKYHDYKYDDYGPAYTTSTSTTTTTTQKIKPEKCYGQELDFWYQQSVSAFSISHLSLIESLLFLSFFVMLTGKKITKGSLFLPGLFLLASSLLTTTFGVFHNSGQFDIEYSLQTFLDNPFLIMNCLSIGTAYIIGIVCLFVGNGFFISLIALIFKVILAIIVFVINVLFTVFGGIMKASETLKKMSSEKKDLTESKVGNG